MTINEIECQIAELMRQRAKLLEDESVFHEKYTVFNNDTNQIDDETYVLTPFNERDRQYLISYQESLPESMHKQLLGDWLSEFGNKRCRLNRICSVGNRAVCCLFCSINGECEEVCNLVRYNAVQKISDCRESL